MGNEKEISEDTESVESCISRATKETQHNRNSEEKKAFNLSVNKKEIKEKQQDTKVSIDIIISEYFTEEKVDMVKALLRNVINKKITKQEIITHLQEISIDPLVYNAFILRIIRIASTEARSKIQSIKENEIESETIKLKGALKEQFLQEIKKDIEDPSYITKTQQQYSFFKRTPEDLSSIVSSRPHLISLFSANYNVLCCKIKKILSVKDLHNRLKKGSFEYKLNEQVSIDTAKCAYTVVIHYLKEIIGKCLDRNGNLDQNLLLNTMFGNVRGVYLLYNNYPPVEPNK